MFYWLDMNVSQSLQLSLFRIYIRCGAEISEPLTPLSSARGVLYAHLVVN